MSSDVIAGRGVVRFVSNARRTEAMMLGGTTIGGSHGLPASGLAGVRTGEGDGALAQADRARIDRLAIKRFMRATSHKLRFAPKSPDFAAKNELG